METISLTIDLVVHQTARAALIDFGSDERWIPFSVIDPESLADLSSQPDEIMVAAWFVKQEGLECYES